MRQLRGFSQARLARAMPGNYDPAYLSRLEAGKERPELANLTALEYGYAKLGEPLDPCETAYFSAAGSSSWTLPNFVVNALERAQVSEIRATLTDLLMRAYRASRARRSEVVREGEIERERYLLK